jgi:hypothetical protein
MRIAFKSIWIYHQLGKAGITKKVSQLVARCFVRFILMKILDNYKNIAIFISRERIINPLIPNKGVSQKK